MFRRTLQRAAILGALLGALVPGVGLASELGPSADVPVACAAPVASGCGVAPVACVPMAPPCVPPAPSATTPTPATALGTPQVSYSPGPGLLVMTSWMDPNPLWPAELCSPSWCYQWDIWTRPAVSPLAVGAFAIPAGGTWSASQVCGCPWPAVR
ncbi:MAG: hypothetical protein IRZ14_12065 [Chloroflexi bacterium]|nr:hypothetical protein [Chloroflexota bacterium]